VYSPRLFPLEAAGKN